MKCPSCSAEVPAAAKFCPECGATVPHKSACPICGAEVPDTAKFCPECGERIVRKTVCPACGTEIAPGAKFCPECGTKVGGTEPTAKRQPKSRTTGPDSDNRTEWETLASRPAPKQKPYKPSENDMGILKPAGNFILRESTFARCEMGVFLTFESIRKIVNAEGPISEELLFSRAMERWEPKARLSPDCRIILEKSVQRVPEKIPVTTCLGKRVYWPVDSNPTQWNCYRVPTSDPRSHRTFELLPLEEIAAAIVAEAQNTDTSNVRSVEDLYPGALLRLGLRGGVKPGMGRTLEAAKRFALGNDDRPPAKTNHTSDLFVDAE